MTKPLFSTNMLEVLVKTQEKQGENIEKMSDVLKDITALIKDLTDRMDKLENKCIGIPKPNKIQMHFVLPDGTQISYNLPWNIKERDLVKRVQNTYFPGYTRSGLIFDVYHDGRKLTSWSSRDGFKDGDMFKLLLREPSGDPEGVKPWTSDSITTK